VTAHIHITPEEAAFWLIVAIVFIAACIYSYNHDIRRIQ